MKKFKWHCEKVNNRHGEFQSIEEMLEDGVNRVEMIDRLCKAYKYGRDEAIASIENAELTISMFD